MSQGTECLNHSFSKLRLSMKGVDEPDWIVFVDVSFECVGEECCLVSV